MDDPGGIVRNTDDQDLREQFQRIEASLGTVEQHADPAVLAAVQEIVQTLLGYHAAGLARLVDALDANARERLVEDELVSSLLVLHGLHPLSLEARVRRALESVRPALHGGDVELIDIIDGGVRVRLHSGGHTCASSGQTIRQAIEQAVHAFAPDVTGLVIESHPAGQRPSETFIPVEQLLHVRTRNVSPLENASCSD
jgi:Fe-S cluster biogenesis protein NfuA